MPYFEELKNTDVQIFQAQNAQSTFFDNIHIYRMNMKEDK